jgi:hypothetical protein
MRSSLDRPDGWVNAFAAGGSVRERAFDQVGKYKANSD